MHRVLVIAGSDSSGGAGLEADQKVIAAHGCYAMTATTALTAQNTTKVFDIHQVPSAFVRKQIDACIDDIGADAIKTGMLASAETIAVVADAVEQHHVPLVVVDPVMVSTSGSKLLPEEAIKTLCERLLPLTSILTPNVPEALSILQHAGIQQQEPKSAADLRLIAQKLQQLGPKAVLLKGGHSPLTKDGLVSAQESDRRVVLNVLASADSVEDIESEYLVSRNTHGTGCSLASAIASNLARGLSTSNAVRAANRYVEAGIRTSKDIGHGSGPINHFHSTYTLPFAPGHFIEYLLERDDVRDIWKAHIEHDFVKQLVQGSLPEDKFKHYLVQDYIFLIHYSRAHALAGYKAKNREDIGNSATIVGYIRDEFRLHLEFCKKFDISVDEIEHHPEDQACTAYTRLLLDVGNSEDWYALQVAMLPCLLGYSSTARRWYADPIARKEDNRYWEWVETYVGEEYSQAVEVGSEIIERHAVRQSSARIEELVQIFIHAIRMEIGFWDMGLNHSKREDL